MVSSPALISILPAIALLLLIIGIVRARSSDPMRRVRGRLYLALGTAAALVLGCLFWHIEHPELLGLPIVVAPGVSIAGGVLVFALPPWRNRRADGPRRAALRVRSARTVMGGGTLVLPVVLLALLVGVLVATGLTADAAGDAAGRSFSRTSGDVGAGASPYPGWFYGLPILLTALLMLASVAVAVHRTVLLPAVDLDAPLDDRWRRTVGRTLGSTASAGLLMYLAGVLWSSGAAWEVLKQTGTTGFETISQLQGLLWQLSALGAVVLLMVAVIRIGSIGRILTARQVTA